MFRDPSNVPGEGIIVGSIQMPAAAPLEAIGKIGTAIGSVTIMRADGVLVRPGVGAWSIRAIRSRPERMAPSA